MLGVQDRLVKEDCKMFNLRSWKNKVCYFLMWIGCERSGFEQMVRIRTQSVVPIKHPSGDVKETGDHTDWDSGESPGPNISKGGISPYTSQGVTMDRGEKRSKD